METTEGRIVQIERTIVEHGQMVNGIREAIISLGARMDRQFMEVEHRINDRFAQIERRLDRVDDRMDLFDAKVSRQFVYLVSLQVMTLIAIVGALGGLLTAILQR